jgi:hypothetical protein
MLMKGINNNNNNNIFVLSEILISEFTCVCSVFLLNFKAEERERKKSNKEISVLSHSRADLGDVRIHERRSYDAS